MFDRTQRVAKALLLDLLDELGVPPLFHLDVHEQTKACAAASLSDLLDEAFNEDKDASRGALIALHLPRVVAAAQSLDPDAVLEALRVIEAVCMADSRAQLAAWRSWPA
jgi:hypothetical protein